eukprot:CAMPEP_0204574066 /NCGR_PEP_ID=MMETSP0661-20131031/40382_1 /ASSEMBLY_ACC=CAM_ASM_000606 /TAXON_ID=109239 /ORGANISM="Alexandrium margalefi, Strain AMGDE01CS-322" /LENGTH=419 /DNA_ID=CAMNT_0051582553 /DNA_START=191 /DNA_END=1450 /DNA_ORIENTATION=+
MSLDMHTIKTLRVIDYAWGLARHITPQSMDAFVSRLESQLSARSSGASPPAYSPSTSRSASTSTPATTLHLFDLLGFNECTPYGARPFFANKCFSNVVQPICMNKGIPYDVKDSCMNECTPDGVKAPFRGSADTRAPRWSSPRRLRGRRGVLRALAQAAGDGAASDTIDNVLPRNCGSALGVVPVRLNECFPNVLKCPCMNECIPGYAKAPCMNECPPDVLKIPCMNECPVLGVKASCMNECSPDVSNIPCMNECLPNGVKASCMKECLPDGVKASCMNECLSDDVKPSCMNECGPDVVTASCMNESFCEDDDGPHYEELAAPDTIDFPFNERVHSDTMPSDLGMADTLKSTSTDTSTDPGVIDNVSTKDDVAKLIHEAAEEAAAAVKAWTSVGLKPISGMDVLRIMSERTPAAALDFG